MHQVITTLLDALGLLLLAAGVGAAAGAVIGWAGLAVAGAIVLAGSWWAQRPSERRPGGER